MIHKFNNVPSLSWLVARLKPYFGQRFEFVVSPECVWLRLLGEDAGFDLSRPILCNGIFVQVMKLPKKGVLGFCGPRDCEPVLYFRDCLFKQDDKVCFLGKNRRLNKRRTTAFDLKEVASGKFAEVCKIANLKMISSSVGEERGTLNPSNRA